MIRRIILVAVGLLVAFLAFGFYLASTPEGKSKQHAREVISYCWRQHDRHSLDPGAKTVVAVECERLEHDFQARYGVAP